MFYDFTNQKCVFSQQNSKFKSYFNEDEINYLLEKYYPEVYNSKGVSLVGIDQITDNKVRLKLAKSDFFSLLLSNILYSQSLDDEIELKDRILKFQNLDEISLDGIFIGSKKLQPIVICSVKLEKSFNEIEMMVGSDSKFEIANYFIVSKSELKDYLSYQMTEASRFQIEKASNI